MFVTSDYDLKVPTWSKLEPAIAVVTHLTTTKCSRLGVSSILTDIFIKLPGSFVGFYHDGFYIQHRHAFGSNNFSKISVLMKRSLKICPTESAR